MELKDFATEELRAELKRRSVIERVKREEEKKNALCCRNCKHCTSNILFPTMYKCLARTWGKKIKRNYVVKPYTKACDKFERKEELW